MRAALLRRRRRGGATVAGDTTAPTLVSSTPADNATGIATTSTIVLRFSETVAKGTGNVLIRGNNGGFATEQTIAVGNAAVALSTTSVTNDTVTITPPSALTAGREYAVQVASGAIVDTAGNAFAGIASDTALSFTVAAAGYTINAVEFDGTNDYIATESGISITGGDRLFMLVSFYIPSGWPTSGLGKVASFLTAAGTERIALTFIATNTLRITASDSAGTSLLSVSFASNSFTAGVWNTLAISSDHRSGSLGWQAYKWTGGAWTALTASGTPTLVAGTIDTIGKFRMGTNSSGGNNKFNVYFADFLFSMAAVLDLTVSGNRDKLLPTVDKGANGSTPLGAQPPIFLSGATASWHTNKGSAGGMTLTGALTTAPSAPT
jgi:methionine-rich copper-binding protein CopC